MNILEQVWDTWEVVFFITPLIVFLLYRKNVITKPMMLFLIAYVSYPAMYVLENNILFMNYLFLFLFITSSILGFRELFFEKEKFKK